MKAPPPSPQNNIFTAVLSSGLIWFNKPGPDKSSGYRLGSPCAYKASAHKIECIVQLINRKRQAQFYVLHSAADFMPVRLPGKRKMKVVSSLQSVQGIADVHAPSVLLLTPFFPPWHFGTPLGHPWKTCSSLFFFFPLCKGLLQLFVCLKGKNFLMYRLREKG